jgi:cytochrome c biogenesis protein
VIDDNKTIQIPLRKINTNGKKFWIGSIPVDMVNEKSISYTVLVNDLYGTILIYNEQGNLIQECLIGQTININFQTMLKFSELLTTTGLQIKTDNGLPLVYGSFLLLMISTYLSFISYSQVWEIEGTDCLIVGGRSNRAVLFFQEELRRLLQKSKSSV